jgi:hypothetical protein
MALPVAITDREYKKFIEDSVDSGVDLRVALMSGGGLVSGVQFDAVTVTYPSATQEVYALRTGGIAGTILKSVTVNYVDATKAELLNASIA